MAKTYEVENVVKAKELVEKLDKEGVAREDMYVFSHEEDLEDKMAEVFHTEEVSMKEQGLMKSIKNVFSKRGDELRSHFETLGLTEQEAADAEKVLDDGRLVLVVK